MFGILRQDRCSSARGSSASSEARETQISPTTSHKNMLIQGRPTEARHLEPKRVQSIIHIRHVVICEICSIAKNLCLSSRLPITLVGSARPLVSFGFCNSRRRGGCLGCWRRSRGLVNVLLGARRCCDFCPEPCASIALPFSGSNDRNNTYACGFSSRLRPGLDQLTTLLHELCSRTDI